MNDSCIFCKIIRGELPASVVAETDTVLAIMDIHPINAGHVLVMPKTCFQHLRQMPEDVASEVFAVVKKVEQALWNTPGIACEGTNIIQNNAKAAGQDVFHVHFHVVPRTTGDGFRFVLPSRKYSRAELGAHAAAIRRNVEP